MAWGFMYPNGFGDYLPEGADFADRDARLSKVFQTQMTDAERAAFNNRFSKYRLSVTEKFRAGDVVLEDHEKPTQLVIPRTPRALGSIFWIANGFIIVEQAVRDIVESLEPGRHQFWNIDIQLPKDKSDGRSWNVLVIGQSCAAFLRDKTDPSALATSFDRFVSLNPTKKSFGAVVLDAAMIGDCHLWRDPTVINPKFFVSDRLMARLDAAGLRLPKHLQVKELWGE
ncbi:imm11 family protein [Arenibacterium sp. CAU 1754]